MKQSNQFNAPVSMGAAEFDYQKFTRLAWNLTQSALAWPPNSVPGDFPRAVLAKVVLLCLARMLRGAQLGAKKAFKPLPGDVQVEARILADLCCTSVPSVRRALRLLTRLGLIEEDSGAEDGSASRYRILLGTLREVVPQSTSPSDKTAPPANVNHREHYVN